jgi:uncharacterized protein (TIGR03435 family)
MTVRDMVELFYHVKPYQVVGGPDWARAKRFDVTGKDSTISAAGPKLTGKDWSDALDSEDEQMRELLTSRFGLKLHHETRVLPTLVLLADAKKRFAAVPCSSGYTLQSGIVKGAIHIASLASLLKVDLAMPVRDSTGLKECYYIDTHWSTNPNDESSPSIATALHDLGFHLERSKGDVDVLVIDHAALPLPD